MGRGSTLRLVDLLLTSLDGLVLGTTAMLLLVTVVVAAVRAPRVRLVVFRSPTPALTRASAPTRLTTLAELLAEAPRHPRRPRAPGIA
jgi:hypothetical protein